jgi:predicted membrane GTPase involved in stress response
MQEQNDLIFREDSEWVTEFANWINLLNGCIKAETDCTIPGNELQKATDLAKDIFTAKGIRSGLKENEARSEAVGKVDRLLGSAKWAANEMAHPDNNTKLKEKKAKRGTRSMAICPNSKAFSGNRGRYAA